MKELILLLIALCLSSVAGNSGFWYGNTRPPETQYDTVPYANFTVKVNRPFQAGPGDYLVKDTYADGTNHSHNLLYTGNTINRQTFDTQFVLDLNYAIGIDPNRVFVLQVTKGDVHFSWESSNVIVNFIMLERNHTNGQTLLECIADLTNQIQVPTSKLYKGTNVTRDIDPLWGLEVKTWDVSLKLTYAIEVVGGDDVIDDYYLNQGSLGICNNEAAQAVEKYCEFERFFEDDVSRALGISFYRVQILFIKAASFDSVLVSFRVLPAMRTVREANVTYAIANLMKQVVDFQSPLYSGNVTLRVDPTWGVSNMFPAQRSEAAKFTLKYYQYDKSRLGNPKRLTEITAYDRCKANRRCNWGVLEHNQSSNEARYFHQLFDNGKLYETNLFLDFEDWRMGIRGFNWEGSPPPIASSNISIRGAHFWPFAQHSLGPNIPCYRSERNQGLILDRSLQAYQVDKQESLVDDLQGRIDWLEENIEVATMGPRLRSRKDVRANLTWVRADVIDWWTNEVEELKELSSSMCIAQSCYIQFNTSSLELTGAINATGVIRKTTYGTETAVFTFNSIYLGPELKVILVGQRALSLVSKTTIVINTTIEATPGTLGGFQGGGSVARYVEDALSDSPRPIYICEIGDYCVNYISPTGLNVASNSSSNVTYVNYTRSNLEIISNNVNGPGSGNLRINAFMMKTSAKYIQEIQNVTTSAFLGQTLAGGFVLMYKNYSTPIIPHDVTASQLKTIIEDNLNLVNPRDNTVYPDRAGIGIAGIGSVAVSRSKQDSQEGFTWNITFVSAIGNSPQITVKSYLQAIDAKVVSGTVQDGNELGGYFQLEFQGNKTGPISPFVSAEQLKNILLQLPSVSTAFVLRTDPTDNCNDGLCQNGPYESHGLLWTIYVTTNFHFDDVTPTSPTDPLSKTTGPLYHFSPLTDNLTGNGSAVTLYWGTSLSNNSPLNLLNITIPFSLAFGGSGGSYGGHGGAGYGINPVGFIYNDKYMTDLVGGSGGCMRSGDLFEINSVLGPTSGAGGHGGGAIELVAPNDIEIGTFGKIIAQGGNAEQSSQGGGGGGSGGGILISSGATVVINGLLDVSGGNGGFGGFLHQDEAGGGGGGGRIALFADSITAPAERVIASGGKCGVYTAIVETPAVELLVGIKMEMLGQLDQGRLSAIADTFIRTLVDPIFVDFYSFEQLMQGKVIHSLLQMNVVINHVNITAELKGLKHLFANTTSNIAEVYISNSTVISASYTTAYPEVQTPTPSCRNNGEYGSIYTEAKMTTSMYVRPTNAAESTSRALFMSNAETTNTSTGSSREAPFAANGPILSFAPSRPTRITYYTRTDGSTLSNKADFGTMFSLISRGEAGLLISNVIGVFFGGAIMHGANFGSAVDEKFFLKRMVTIDPYPILSRWYKIDIRIQWASNTYSILIDDTSVAVDQPFKAGHVDGIRLSVFRSVDVWFDEIYIGFDNTMEFQCPISLRTGTTTAAPVQKAWSFQEVHGGDSNGYTEYKKMSRHYNFLDTVGSIAFDGQGAIEVYQDIKGQYADGDYPHSQGLIHAGALVYLTDSLRSKKTPLRQSYTLVSPNGLWSGAKDGPGGAGDGRQFWYTEYSYDSSISPTLNGGIAACSSQDLITWRFEGIVFHYTNLSNMVNGSHGPFYMERPKVLFNPETSNYVMWAAMDRPERDLAMSAIATSPYEDGPFLFVRSFYPDGNKTRDQVIFETGNNSVIARTYYQTVEFIIPEAMMQPTWESAKSRSGTINYRSNYHRAFYHIGYDNYNDIFAQRWRKEDIPYQVGCKNKITNEVRYIASGKYNDEGFVCDDPSEEKVITGQGLPIITTRFVSPNDSENSWWRPTSVPNVHAQAWSSNYQDGYCGIRKLNDDYAEFDPLLEDFVPVARNTCSNIADNPVHESMQDKLIGVLHVIVTRRAKYIAVSKLTPDYLDTTGALNVFEGEMETGDLISIIMESGQFGFGSGDDIKSTFYPPVRSQYETAIDYNTRFSQYIRNHNDRATYSLACVLDGICPVNFKSQLTKGQN